MKIGQISHKENNVTGFFRSSNKKYLLIIITL